MHRLERVKLKTDCLHNLHSSEIEITVLCRPDANLIKALRL